MYRNLEARDVRQKIEKPIDTRNNKIWLFMGTNRTGKSVTARKVAENWRNSRPTDKIVGFDPQNVFTGMLDYELKLDEAYDSGGDWSDFINKNDFKDCLVIIDEFRILNPKSTATKGLIRLMGMRSDRNLDIIIIIHSPSLIIDILGGFVSDYFLFNTFTTVKKVQDKIPNWETIVTGINKINEYCVKNGVYTAKYNDGKDHYPNFPYVYYSVKDNQLYKVNFNLDSQ